MSDKGLFLQNIIAIIWDFDKTLTPRYMQTPLFEAYGVDEKTFWKEVNGLAAYYKRAGVQVQPDTSYLGHLLTYVKEGRMPDLTNARLRELGAEIGFFPGIPQLFGELQGILDAPTGLSASFTPAKAGAQACACPRYSRRRLIGAASPLAGRDFSSPLHLTLP